jgi:hypothetical protein
MLRRYLVALLGAAAGGGAALGFYLAFGLGADYRAVGVCALAVAGFLMAKGEDFGLVPPSDEVGRPTSLFSDEKERRRR